VKREPERRRRGERKIKYRLRKKEQETREQE